MADNFLKQKLQLLSVLNPSDPESHEIKAHDDRPAIPKSLSPNIKTRVSDSHHVSTKSEDDDKQGQEQDCEKGLQSNVSEQIHEKTIQVIPYREDILDPDSLLRFYPNNEKMSDSEIALLRKPEVKSNPEIDPILLQTLKENPDFGFLSFAFRYQTNLRKHDDDLNQKIKHAREKFIRCMIRAVPENIKKDAIRAAKYWTMFKDKNLYWSNPIEKMNDDGYQHLGHQVSDTVSDSDGYDGTYGLVPWHQWEKFSRSGKKYMSLTDAFNDPDNYSPDDYSWDVPSVERLKQLLILAKAFDDVGLVAYFVDIIEHSHSYTYDIQLVRTMANGEELDMELKNVKHFRIYISETGAD